MALYMATQRAVSETLEIGFEAEALMRRKT